MNDIMPLCNCGCGNEVTKIKNRYIKGHTNRGKKFSIETRKKISKSRIGRFKGIYNPNWKGGYFTKNIPLHDNFFEKISFADECRRNEKDNKILEVRCTHCNKWFIPKMGDVYHRLLCLENIGGESRFYCSEKCKNKCEIFSSHANDFINKQNNIKSYTDQEYKIFRQVVLERDDYICQFCGKVATDVHHERPQKIEPFFALDPDFAWSCCGKCHREKGHRTETNCDVNILRNIVCEK